MNIKAIAGAVLAALLVGVGVLAGSVVGNASAQTKATDPTTPGTTPSTTNPANPTNPTNPTDPSTNPSNGMPQGRGFGGPGMHGGMGGGMGMKGFGGPEGFGGPGMRGEFGKGMAATADGATAAISRTNELITLVKDDLTYANGKMDTANVQRWLTSADTLVKSAQTALQNSKYGQAVGYAGAAMQLAMIADNQMGQTLGFDKLPSYSKRPQMGHRGDMMNNTATVTQAQASRVLARTYEELVMQAAVLKNSSEAGSYLTEAQNAYKTAYDSYTAGKYNDAVSAARLADQLAGVAHQVYETANAPTGTDTPVTVPQPNF